ncbi:MAG TPA: response regulator, partial [Xanthomonadales bacterium]|nr:response regulator [Xanthomonadales bacterium]
MAHVLIVDDEAAFAEGMAEYLRVKGHTATVAPTLAQARDVLPKQAPDVVLLDLMLPDGSGLELFDAFEDQPP